ncbi:MAG: trigger factor [Nitrospirota bacterium]
MSTTIEDISNTKKRLKIEIPTDIIEKEYKESLDKVKHRAKIPGFRQGKVPVNLIEKKFGDDIKADIIDRLVPEYYSKALKEADLVPVALPRFESNLDIKKNEPLSFSLTVEVRPNISNLNYEGLKVEAVDTSIEDKEVEETLKGLQEERAVFEAVDRGIREDDLIVIDYVKLDASGEKELSSGKDQVMNLGNNLTPKGILDEIVGRKKSDVVEISLPEIEGGEVKEGTDSGSRLRITIKEVKEKKLQPVDDEFAKDFGHETLESLKAKINEGILKAKQDKAAKQQKAGIVEILVESHDFDIPEALLEKELENLIVNERLSRKQSKELIKEAGAEKSSDKDEVSDLREKLKPQAIKNVKTMLLLDMIAEKEGINVSESEIKEKIALLARHLQTTPDAVINLFVTKDGSLENFKNTIRDEKVLDLLLSRAEIVKGE